MIPDFRFSAKADRRSCQFRIGSVRPLYSRQFEMQNACTVLIAVCHYHQSSFPIIVIRKWL